MATSDDWNHWGLYSKLRDVRHRSVATFLWMASFEDHMLVCSLYEGRCFVNLVVQHYHVLKIIIHDLFIQLFSVLNFRKWDVDLDSFFWQWFLNPLSTMNYLNGFFLKFKIK